MSIRPLTSRRTRSGLKFDAMRAWARIRHGRRVAPPSDRLHFGCGARRVAGWLNVDVAESEYDVDLGGGSLPWKDDSFRAVVGQQVIEHLELDSELLPLLSELRRTMVDGGELWLSTPDMEKVCRSYFEHRGADLIEDRRTRFPTFSLGDRPSQHMINVYFHQGSEHRNLFDFDLLAWALDRSGFSECTRVDEARLLERFPEFPARNDDCHALYVRAVA